MNTNDVQYTSTLSETRAQPEDELSGEVFPCFSLREAKQEERFYARPLEKNGKV